MMIDLGRVFNNLARPHADLPALMNLERGRVLTHGEMHLLSNRISNLLTGRFGLGRGDFYATILDNDNMGLFHPWMFKCPVSAVWIDIRESLPERLNQLDHTGARVVFAESRLAPELAEPLSQRGISLVCMDPLKKPLPGALDFQELVRASSEAEVKAELDLEDPEAHTALLRFTGGTTGRAKCAAYSLANLWTWGLNPAHYMETFPYHHPRALFFSPLNHAASGSVVIPALVRGGLIATLNRADPELLGQTIAAHKIQMIYAVPTVLYRMLEVRLAQKFDLKSLRTIRYGGASIAPAKLEALLEIFGPIFVQGYGSTECWPSVTILGREEHRTDGPEWVARLGSIGRPFPGQEVLVCDETGAELPPGQEGEILIRGINTIKGYYKDPAQTKANFTPSGFWKSGDVGRFDQDGYLFLVDRKKDMIISGGYNVYATEVENCLNAHPAVRDSAVVGLPDDYWGEAVCAVVVLNEGQTAEVGELRAHCKKLMASYKAPKRIEIVDNLPLSPAGKVLRRRVRDWIKEVPEPE